MEYIHLSEEQGNEVAQILICFINLSRDNNEGEDFFKDMLNKEMKELNVYLENVLRKVNTFKMQIKKKHYLTLFN